QPLSSFIALNSQLVSAVALHRKFSKPQSPFLRALRHSHERVLQRPATFLWRSPIHRGNSVWHSCIGGNNDKGKENQRYDGICRSSTYRNNFLFNPQGERAGINS